MLVTLMVIVVPTIAVVASYLLARQRVEEIHGLVNGRLGLALKEIEDLKEEIGVLKLKLNGSARNDG